MQAGIQAAWGGILIFPLVKLEPSGQATFCVCLICIRHLHNIIGEPNTSVHRTTPDQLSHADRGQRPTFKLKYSVSLLRKFFRIPHRSEDAATLLPDILLRAKNNEGSGDTEGANREAWPGRCPFVDSAVFVGEGRRGRERAGGRVATRPRIHGATAERSVQSEHIRGRRLRDTIASIPRCQRWLQICPALSGWHCSGSRPQQMAPNAPQPGEAGPTCDSIVFSLANRREKTKPWMRKERHETDTQTFTYLHCPPRVSDSPLAEVSRACFPPPCLGVYLC